MVQSKNTINEGDAFKDLITRQVKKEKIGGVWYGPVESDRQEQSYDLMMSEKTFMRIFGVAGGGRVKLGWRNANITQRKLLTDLPLEVDTFVHVRFDKSDYAWAIIVKGANIMPYINEYGRTIKRDSGTQYQLNVPAPLPNIGSKAWNKIFQYASDLVRIDGISERVNHITAKVNTVGRVEAQGNPSNPFNAKRKVGYGYKERPN